MRLTLVDVAGRRMQTLLDAERAPGSYAVPLDGGALAAGTYFVRLEAPDRASVQRAVFVR